MDYFFLCCRIHILYAYYLELQHIRHFEILQGTMHHNFIVFLRGNWASYLGRHLGRLPRGATGQATLGVNRTNIWGNDG